MTSAYEHDLLLDELELFVRRRLLLLLLPIQDRLRKEGSHQLAEILAITMKDIRHNLQEILASQGIGASNGR